VSAVTSPASTGLPDRAAGCLGGAAIGDALGGAVEGYLPAQIIERHGGRVQGIVGPWSADWRTARPISPHHKGDGHVTDDTLMTRVLARAYLAKRGHLDAYDMVDLVAPQLSDDVVWIPELEDNAPVLRRLAAAEQWLHIRLIRGHADPREAGVGNLVNCGAAMYIAPVGIVNAADPDVAYAEAIDLAGAHQWSYGREAAGVMAACVAQALAPGADIESVLATALRLARDGTHPAIAAVTEAARAVDLDGDYATPLRAAMAPFDTVGEDYRDNPGLGARRASRLHAIEELPLALGVLVAGGGDFRRTVLAAVNYGRDCDSIATMAGALLGCLQGTAALPQEWVTGVREGSRMDIFQYADELSALAVELAAGQLSHAERRWSAISSMQTDISSAKEER
jgi:ADP-ribosylglycohydrolase